MHVLYVGKFITFPFCTRPFSSLKQSDPNLIAGLQRRLASEYIEINTEAPPGRHSNTTRYRVLRLIRYAFYCFSTLRPRASYFMKPVSNELSAALGRECELKTTKPDALSSSVAFQIQT